MAVAPDDEGLSGADLGSGGLSRLDRLIQIADRFVWVASGEWLLTRPNGRNGGTVVFLRALQVAILVNSVALLLKNVLDPSRIWWTFSLTEFRKQLSNSGPTFGAIFAAAYVTFYTRFASQWSYLAGVYNQIKGAEARRGVSRTRIAQWKAGFIEDAYDLHLLRKKMFASIAHAWLSRKEVRDCFCTYTPNGDQLLSVIRDQVEAVIRSNL